MSSRRFDAIVVGAGQSGPALAGRLTTAGMSVAVVERKHVGGTCVNTGCMPTKAMVASSYAAHQARRAADYGVSIGGPISIDMKAVKARHRQITLNSRTNIESWLGGMERCTLLRGHARFVGPKELNVGGERIAAEKIFLNVGGRAAVPDIPGIAEIGYLTNVSILELDVVPGHLVIVGGSYIGLEFAQAFRRFGAEVTIVEKSPRLIPREDEDVSAAVLDLLQREGISVRLNASCITVKKRGDGIAVGVDCTSGAPEIEGSHLLMAVGRVPNTDDLGLEAAGIVADARGFVTVDDQLRTSVPGIWAMGDCNGRGAFTHTSYNDFEIVAANLLDDDPRRVSDRIPCYALYTDPPLGRVGMTETEARKSGRRLLVGIRPMTRVGRAIEKGETLGFMKMIADADTKEILGGSILGTGGDEAIHCVLDTMYARAPYTTIQRAVHIHPTVSELIPTVFGEMKPAQ